MKVVYKDDIGAPMFAIEVDECEHVFGYVDVNRGAVMCDICEGVIVTLYELENGL